MLILVAQENVAVLNHIGHKINQILNAPVAQLDRALDFKNRSASEETPNVELP